MNILAVDTSGGACSVAVLQDSVIRAESYMNAGRTHSETLGPMIDFCLSCAGVGIRDIELFSCAVGPGSFTGLRIGIGMLKGFAHASGKPVIGVNTLDALARNAEGTDETICPIIDARRGEVYTATYRSGERIIDCRAVPLDTVLEELHGRRVVFLGDAAVNYSDKICTADAGYRIAHGGIVLQRAGSVGRVAFEMFQSGLQQDAYSIEPFYLRETQAARVRAERGNQ